MNSTKMTLQLAGREIILIGTAHVSQESINEVREAIKSEQPDQVCVELDAGRYASMIEEDNWEKLNMVKVFREGKGFLLMANLVLSGFQRRMGESLGVKPGEEMKAALETAAALDIPHSLCDREIQITLRRAWSRCGLWSKTKLLASLVSSALSTEKLSSEEIENLKAGSELDGMMDELSSFLPKVKETLIDERDKYLAAKIWTSGPGAVQGTETTAGGFRQLAVIGAGHMKGIKAHLEGLASGSESADLSALETLPPAGFLSRAAGWLFPLAIAALLVLGFFKAGAGVSLEMLIRWVLWNGSLAALGSLIALGHPLSILVSFIGAPVATINPFIGVGIFSGVTEALMRKPRVKDAQDIAADVGSLKGIYRNRITRALLVFFLSSIGGMIGNFISIPSLAALLTN
ncbi:MAG: TraB/GumN family protein [Treponema sp.]|nr:TraB/GumN family protein [Treponema sp.]